MSSLTPDPAAPVAIERRGVRLGDLLFKGIAAVAAVGVAAVLGFLTYKVFALAWPAMQKYGLSFIWTQGWNPNTNVYGALVFIYGTIVTAFIALLLATPLSIAIALFLTEIAPKRLAAPIATMVELLAAIPSVVLGLWGILVFGPWIANHLEPWLQSWFGFLPDLLGRPVPGGGAAGGPRADDHDHPDHLGDLPGAVQPRAARSHGRVARARLDPLGGDPPRRDPLCGAGHLGGGAARARARVRRGDRRYAGDRQRQHDQPVAVPSRDTLASRIASTYQGASNDIEVQSLLYLGAILLVISLVTNVSAQLIVNKFQKARRMSTG